MMGNEKEKIVIQSTSVEELVPVAEKIIELAGNKKIISLYGEMGAGKTTLVKVLCKQLGVKENVSSPTFSLVNEYHSDIHSVIYHFDFYRIDSPSELLDIGIEEYFSSGSFCIIEWPEKALTLIPSEALKIYIDVNDGTREIVVFK